VQLRGQFSQFHDLDLVCAERLKGLPFQVNPHPLLWQHDLGVTYCLIHGQKNMLDKSILVVNEGHGL
jgi:hypothetical protein